MRISQLVGLVLCASSPLISLAVAQDSFPYTDSATGIQFSSQAIPEARTKGGLQFGVAFPPKLDKNEYIGHIVGSRPNGAGWTGITHSGAMRNTLLLVTWADGNDIKTSFRYATGYMAPREYTGNAKLTPLGHSVNATHFTLTYHCQGCFSWSYNGAQGNQSLTKDAVLFGWAQSAARPSRPKDAQSPIQYHSNGFGTISSNPRAAANPSYDSYLAGGAKQSSPSPSAQSPPPPSVNSTLPGVSPSAPSVGSSPSPALPQISAQPSPSLPLGAPKIPVPTSTASTPIPSLTSELPKLPLTAGPQSGFPKGGPMGYGGPKGYPKGPPKGIAKGPPKGFPKGGPPFGFPSWDDDD